MSSQQSTFKFHNVADILRLPDPLWIIDKILAKGSFAVLYGAPGVGKSFLALSGAFEVAAERSWLDKKVNGGPVLYVAAEGFGGLKLRVAALLHHEGLGADVNWKFLDCPVNLMDPEKLSAFIKDIQTFTGKPALIIIDNAGALFRRWR